jgi:iron complex transport system substrate-binding protein
MRIVSLLPSATEIVCALGLTDDLVGVTFECDYPAAARTKPVVSDTTLPSDLAPAEIDRVVSERADAHAALYTLDEGALRALDPEVILTQDLCAVCAVDVADVHAALAHLGCRARVVTLDPKRLEDVLTSIEAVGAATGRDADARALVAHLRDRLARVASAVRSRPSPRTFVLEWTDPPYNAGHWIPDMVAAAGGEPILARPGEYSAPLEWPTIVDAEPDVVVIAPCGYGLDATRAVTAADRRLRDELARTPAGSARVWAVDASSYFVRPGPRLVDGVEILAGILHPDRWPPPAPEHAGTVRVTDR